MMEQHGCVCFICVFKEHMTDVSNSLKCFQSMPPRGIREQCARGIIMAFPSLKDPYTKNGYEHFYDAASRTGHIAWRLKTIEDIRGKRPLSHRAAGGDGDALFAQPQTTA